MRGRSWTVMCGALGLLACGQRAARVDRQPPPPRTTEAPRPPGRARPQLAAQGGDATLPRDEGPYYPSLMRVQNQALVDIDAFADVAACAGCHEAAFEQWSHSAHAHASFDNPWYRASVDALRQDVSFAASRHCGGCHDPLLLVSGKMDGPVAAEDPLASAGVTCLVCHSVQEAAADGNAALTLTSAPVPIPQPDDPQSLQAHRARLATKALRSPKLCGNCHRGFLGIDTGNAHHLFGMDDQGAWSASAFGGSRSQTLEEVAAQGCADCHMRRERTAAHDPSSRDGALRSHRAPGSHTPLAALLRSPEQQQAIAEQLAGAVRLDVPVVYVDGHPQRSDEPLQLAPGQHLAVDVTMRNLRVGHSFPGGLKDMQDSWVEFLMRDESGRVIASSGRGDAKADPSTFYLRALVVDASGRAETRHEVSHFGTVAYDHTIPPLEARAVRYALEVPAKVRPPLQVEVRLHHRKHRAELREAACAATRSSRGRQFIQADRDLGRPPLDGCAKEPITLVAETRVTLGAAEARAIEPWERLYDHALGLSHNVQERLHEARESALQALSLLGDDGQPRARANLLRLLGRIAARRGRATEAVALADEAEALVGPHPAIERVRADAYLQVWRFDEAAAALDRLVSVSPNDTAAHRDLARARLSAQDTSGALKAAQKGLSLQPRDEGLLRVQALALRDLGSPLAEDANEAYLHYREADETTHAKLACDHTSILCARDRMPVVTVALHPPHRPK